MSLEEHRDEMNQVADQVRKRLRTAGVDVSAAGGFTVDLIEALIRSNRLLLVEIGAIDTDLAKAAKGMLEDVLADMKRQADQGLDQEAWPLGILPTGSIGTEALLVAHNELRNWNSSTTEQRFLAIFKYLSVSTSEYNDWCAAFVSWCLREVPKARWGTTERQKSANALSLRRKFAEDPSTKNCVYVPDQAPLPQPGDVVFWWRGSPPVDGTGSGHTGFVLSVTATSVHTIEANVSKSVGVHEYKFVGGKMTFDKGGGTHGYVGLMRLP